MKIQRYFDDALKKHFWKIDLTISGKRIRESGLATKADAEEIITKLKAARRTRRHGLPIAAAPITLKRLREARAADLSSFKPKLTLQMLDTLIGLCHNGILLTELRRSHIRALTDVLRARNLKPSTINLYLACVSSALHDAGEYFAQLDDWQPPKISRVAGVENRERVLSREELGRLFTFLGVPPARK